MARRLRRWNGTTWITIVDFDTMDAAVTGLDTRIDTLESTDTAYDTRLDTLEAYDLALDGRLDTLEGHTLDARLDVLEGQTLDARITALPKGVLSIMTGSGPVTVVQGASQDFTGLSSSITFQSGRRYRLGITCRAVNNQAPGGGSGIHNIQLLPVDSSNGNLFGFSSTTCFHWSPATMVGGSLWSGFTFTTTVAGDGLTRQVKWRNTSPAAFASSYVAYMDGVSQGWIEDLGAS